MMTRCSLGSSVEPPRFGCRMRIVSLVLFITLFVAACWGVGMMIKSWS